MTFPEFEVFNQALIANQDPGNPARNFTWYGQCRKSWPDDSYGA
jgi:hypothetical protein